MGAGVYYVRRGIYTVLVEMPSLRVLAFDYFQLCRYIFGLNYRGLDKREEYILYLETLNLLLLAP